MRKLLLALALVNIGTLSMASPTEINFAHTGFYLGGAIGFSSFGAEHDTTALGADVDRNDYINQARHTRQDFTGNLAIGYDFTITPTFALGIEARWLPQNFSVESSPEQTIYDDGIEQIVAQSTSKTTLNNNSAQLLLKPEFFVDTNSYAYVLFGMGYTEEKLTSNVNYNTITPAQTTALAMPEITASKSAFPIIYGLGYMRYFKNNLNFFAEVTDAYYPSITAQKSLNTATTPLFIQASAQTVNLLMGMVGLAYHF